LITRDIIESGLICQHCSDTCVPWDEVPAELQSVVRPWAEEYGPVHEIAHWEEDQRGDARRFDDKLETAARAAERILGTLGTRVAPSFLEYYPAVVWEDQDECLEVRPEDIRL
jgi:hypothetical protein